MSDERQFDVMYQYREQRDRIFACLKQIMYGDYDMDGADVDTGRMFRECMDKDRSRLTSQIHTLRQRCETLTRELEQLRAGQHVTPVVRHFDFTSPEPETE